MNLFGETDEDEFEDDEITENGVEYEVAYKILSGSESKVERELNILAHEGWEIEEMHAFDSNNGTVVVVIMSVDVEDSFEEEIKRANNLLYP